MKRIGLIAVDSPYPNLVLMKISAWHNYGGKFMTISTVK